MKIFLLFYLFLIHYAYALSSFLDIKKISTNGDYLILLDCGLYIYNYEKQKCEFIRDIKESNLNKKDINNNIIISKIENIKRNVIKITVLINEHLFIYTYPNKNVEYILLNSLVDKLHNIYPFIAQIDDDKLIINSIKYEYDFYFHIKSYIYYNYLQTQNTNKSEKNIFSDFSNKKPFCLFDTYNKIIKCIYYKNYSFHFLTIKDNFIQKNNIITFTESKITFTFSKCIDLVCCSSNNATKCFYKNNANDTFQSISYNFRSKCIELKAYFFEEKEEFVLNCKIQNNYFLYIIDENNINENIKEKKFFLENYNGKTSIIFNTKINSYDIVYDYNFTNVCEKCNQNKEHEDFTKRKLSMNEDITFKSDSVSRSEEETLNTYMTDGTFQTISSTNDIMSQITDFTEKTEYIFNSKSSINNVLNENTLSNLFDFDKTEEIFSSITNTNNDITESTITDFFESEKIKYFSEKKEEIFTIIKTSIIENTITDLFESDNISIFSESTEKIFDDLIYSTEKNDFSDYVNDTNIITQKKEILETEKITQYKIDSTIITEKIIDEEITTEIKKEHTKLSKKQILNNPSSLLDNTKIGINYEITGDGFKIIIKPTNSTLFQNQNVTYVDFDECERKLRDKYKISNSRIITFLQMEIKNEDKNALYNQIKYLVYDDKKQELDLNLCNDIKANIHYNLKEENNLDFISINEFQKKGIDIFNIKDEFFNDICSSFSDSNNDVIIEDRKKYLFKNYSLCEEGCIYNNFDVEKMKIICTCKIQKNFNEKMIPLIFEQKPDISLKNSNLRIINCYNLVFKLNNKSNNSGFIICIFLILIYIIFFFYFITKGIKYISNFVFNEMVKFGYLIKDNNGNFVIKKSEKNNETEITSLPKEVKKKGKFKRRTKKVKISGRKSNNKLNSIIENDNNLKDSNISNYKFQKSYKNAFIHTQVKSANEYEEKEKEIDNFGIIRINLDENNKNFIPKESNQCLENYTLDEAFKFEKRDTFRIIYIYLLSKQIIFHTFLLNSPLKLFSVRFTLFIFILISDLGLNALFYSNDIISVKYLYSKNAFVFSLSYNFNIIIYSILITYILIILMKKLIDPSNAIRDVFRKEEKKIKMKSKNKYSIDDKKKKEIHFEIEQVFRRYKIKLFFLFFFQIILILFFWYFVIVFCHVYSSTQTSWLFDTFLSIVYRFFIDIIISFVFGKLYRMAISSNLETLFKIIMFLYSFS